MAQNNDEWWKLRCELVQRYSFTVHIPDEISGEGPREVGHEAVRAPGPGEPIFVDRSSQDGDIVEDGGDRAGVQNGRRRDCHDSHVRVQHVVEGRGWSWAREEAHADDDELS